MALTPIDVVDDGIVQLLEHAGAAIVQRAVYKSFHDALDLRVVVVDVIRNVVVVLFLLNLVNGCTKDVLVLHASFLCNLYVCAVQRTQRNRAVEHQLHVAGAGGLGACGRNLLGYVCSRYQLLSVGYVVVLYKDNAQLVANLTVVFYETSDFVNQLDDALCTNIARRSLCTKDEGGRMEVLNGAVLQAVVEWTVRSGTDACTHANA